jgi:cytoskeletal protein RodZ
MVETVGRRLQRARLAKKLEIEDVAQATKIRPERIIDLEAEEYGQFPNLTYAKSFLAKYARYLGVDIQEELDNFQLSNSISLGDYQYLSSTPPKYVPAPRAPRLAEPRGFRVPALAVILLIVFIAVAVPMIAYLAINVPRLASTTSETAVQDDLVAESPTPERSGEISLSPTEMLRALAQEPSPAPTQAVNLAASPAPTPAEAVRLEGNVEVRRALPVSPSSEAAPRALPEGNELNAIQQTSGADGTPAAEEKTIEIRVLKRTWIKVTRDERNSEPIFEGFTGPDSDPIVVQGRRFWVQSLDKGFVEVRRDGQLVAGDSDGIVID